MTHKGTVQLETERLVLRPFRAEDARAVFENWASDPEVTKYLTWPTHTTIESSEWFVNYCIDQYKDPSSYQWGIERKEDGKLIGNISVVHLNEEISSAQLGWVIGREYWGNEYVPEAARRVIAFLFDEVGASRVNALHDTLNVNSGRVMQKAGMKYEGTMRQCKTNNRGVVDCAFYSILRDEYEKSR